jgi:NAD(P)-dependent dehydrogenase (short-subunit alcohol dehydrogenase family)
MSAPARPRRVAVVTGASSGIGRAVALRLAADGLDLVLGYRSNASGARSTAAAAAEHGGEVRVFQLDLAWPEAAATALEDALDDRGVDVLVNNAGINRRAWFVDEDVAAVEHTVAVDLLGPFACCQVAARRMIAQGRGGRIVNVTSVHEHVPLRGASSYCAAKAALGAVTKVMALELAEHGITVNAVAPGETATPMNGVPHDVDAAELDRPAIPAGRPGRPQEVADLVGHLAGAGAAYTTGTSIVVDGGLSLMAAVANQERSASLAFASAQPTQELS